MSENIRVSEVSDILRKQLEGINANVQLDEIGTVLQVSDGVVRIYGLRNAEANELLEFDNGIKAIVMNLEEDNVGAVLLGPTDRIKEGFIVKRTKRIASIRVGEGCWDVSSTRWVNRSTAKGWLAVNFMICRWNGKLRE
ncbi:hypothetical protein KUBF_21940 [Bacteroides finegoldii]|nr:hypothetical protein KUBF_21940 [Bacteroides finegoldii]